MEFSSRREQEFEPMEYHTFPFTNKHPSTISPETYISKIIDTLKAIILTALQEGYNKESYLVKNHVYYIKKIESANDPEGYIHYTAKKLLPEIESSGRRESYTKKIAEIQAKYATNPDLAFRIIKVYDLYNNIPREAPPRRKITEDEAGNILVQLLNNSL